MGDWKTEAATSIHYDLRLTTTASGVGYFSCVPPEELFFSDMLEHLRKQPHDDFMHRHLVEMLALLTVERVERFIVEAKPEDAVLRALLLEVSLACEKFSPLLEHFPSGEWRALAAHTPLIDLRSHLLPDHEIHARWSRLFHGNMLDHKALPAPGQTGLPGLYGEGELQRLQTAPRASLETLPATTEVSPGGGVESPTTLEETTAKALEGLERMGVLGSMEMRHAASLSPHALFRQWKLALTVRNGRLDHSLSGTQTSYGKGLSLEAARASCAMEMVERVCSFASFEPGEVLGYSTLEGVIHATHRQLKDAGENVLDPNDLALEVPYENQPLHWVEGLERFQGGLRRILVPAQCVFLFCNLDEVSLSSGLGSTGLASGNTLEQARLSGLLEVLERDAEAVTPFDPGRCFTLEARDPILGPLLEDYRARGIHVAFQDMTPSHGVPCTKCFVVSPDGSIVKGTGAHLDGRKALVSALTETPYPYPYGPPSAPCPRGLPTAFLHEMPDHSTGSAAGDLALLEALIMAHGHRPIYVDLTRSDLGIPVVRAMAPGLEFMADFDRFTRISPRLFANYLRMFDGRSSA